MAKIQVTRSIDASVEKVFETIAEIDHFSKAVPHITKVERLSGTSAGVGTRFRETRIMKGREATTELEITEYVQNERVRFVSDAGGAIWDTIFTVAPKDGGCKLDMEMEARPHKFMARLVTPFIMGMVAKAVESDMDSVKAYCEAP